MKNLTILFQPKRLFHVICWYGFNKWRWRFIRWLKKYRQGQKSYPFVSGLYGSSTYSGRALLAYVIDPFLPNYDHNEGKKHSNHWRTKAITSCLNDLGYIVDVIHYMDSHSHPAQDYDVIIGLGPAYEASCRRKSKDCIGIYLGTTAYPDQLIKAEKDRIEQLRLRRGVVCSRRCHLWLSNIGPLMSDVLFLLGSDWVISTYQNELNLPIYRFPNTVVRGISASLDAKNFQIASKHFLWFSRAAAIHRGLDLLLEVFTQMPEFHLWICGRLDFQYDFIKIYERELKYTQNIHYLGWVDVTSQQFKDLASQCAFIIHPSASDAMPGSVVNCMAAGLIPLVTLETGIDTGGHGKLIMEYTYEAIQNILLEFASRPSNDLRNEAESIVEFTKKRYSKEAFLKAFRANLRSALNNALK